MRSSKRPETRWGGRDNIVNPQGAAFGSRGQVAEMMRGSLRSRQPREDVQRTYEYVACSTAAVASDSKAAIRGKCDVG